MDRNAFHKLVLLTKDVGGLTDGKYMSSSEKLAMFLNILAHHEKNRSIKVDYIRSGWSVSQVFNECLRAILKLTSLFLVNPKPILEDEIEDRWKWFKGCLDALDGTYIHIRVPSEYKPRYRTRKGDIATNDQLADGHVLRDAVVRRNGLKIPEGDNPPPRCREELFNMKHARARNVIERAFGLLKGRWGILRSSPWYSIKMDVDPLDMDMEEQVENQPEHIDVVESSEEWTTWRDELAQSMWNAISNQ
ncbi:hypothetical protein KY285_021149 [Solanum tuberosum]|nr:hypothetical protein KY285_021149 [Solanum tuberosum]